MCYSSDEFDIHRPVNSTDDLLAMCCSVVCEVSIPVFIEDVPFPTQVVIEDVPAPVFIEDVPFPTQVVIEDVPVPAPVVNVLSYIIRRLKDEPIWLVSVFLLLTFHLIMFILSWHYGI